MAQPAPPPGAPPVAPPPGSQPYPPPMPPYYYPPPPQRSSSFTITVRADSFQFAFPDTTSLGQLDPGDRFRIVATSGFHPNTEYEFEFIWLNTGGPVGFARWTTP